jgi:hypothetical protein
MPQARPLTLAAIAIALVTIIFFDVIFLKSSFQPSNINPLIGHPDAWAIHSIFPQLNPLTTPGYGYADLGSTAWQGEPARYLMARDFRAHESPYWNPYSASGTLGPETLVDIKFSPWTLISAWFFDSSPASFDYGLIIIYIIGATCVLLLLNHFLQLNYLASVAGAGIYLLNGFAIPNLDSQNGQAYFFAPLLLYALIGFSKQQSILRWIAVAIVHALMFTLTMLPTLLLVLVTTHMLNLAWLFSSLEGKRRIPFLKAITLLVWAGFTGLCLTGFLWIPVLDSFFVSDMLGKYQSRSIQPTHQIESVLSIFTPKHFWQACSQMLHTGLYPAANLEKDESLIAYIGIFPAILASFAIPKNIRETQGIVLVSILLLLFSYARVFGLTGFIDHIPIVANISIQYFGSISAIALIMLVAYGVENIQRGNFTIFPAIAVIAIIVAAFLILYFKLGFVDRQPYHQYLKIILLQIALAIMAIFLLTRQNSDRNEMTAIMISLSFFELFFYMNTVRPLRFNPVDRPPSFINFLKQNIGDSRAINIGWGRSLYPEYGAMYGIRQVDTQNPGQLPWYRDFYTRHFGSDNSGFLTLGTTVEQGRVILPDRIMSEAALDIANVKYVLVVEGAKPYVDFFRKKNYPVVFQKDRLTIFENPHLLSTATLVPALLSSDIIPESEDFHPSLLATTQDAQLLAQARQLNIPVLDKPDNNSTPIAGKVVLASYHNTEITMDTESAQAAILALSEVWHPGWKAIIDGQPVYIGRINEAFRGIALPAGQHHIRVYYDPASIRYGRWLSIATALVLAVLLALPVRAYYSRRGE